MNYDKDIFRARIRIIAVNMPRPGRLGSLMLDGLWQCAIADASAQRLKPRGGEEIEVGEIIRLLSAGD